MLLPVVNSQPECAVFAAPPAPGRRSADWSWGRGTRHFWWRPGALVAQTDTYCSGTDQSTSRTTSGPSIIYHTAGKALPTWLAAYQRPDPGDSMHSLLCLACSEGAPGAVSQGPRTAPRLLWSAWTSMLCLGHGTAWTHKSLRFHKARCLTAFY